MDSVIVVSKDYALKNYNKLLKGRKNCYYLSEDYRSLIELRRELKDFNIKQFNKFFHQTYDEIFEELLTFSHLVNLSCNNDIVWQTQVGSRNVASTPMVRNIVYCVCVQKLLQVNHGVDFIFIIDSLDVGQAIVEISRKLKREIKCKFLLGDVWKKFAIHSQMALFATFYLIRSTLLWFYVKFLLKPKKLTKDDNKERYILRSWVTKGVLDQSNSYHDRNFGVLPDFLKKKGMDVWFLPMYFNLGQSIFKQIKVMSKSQEQFIFPEQYLSLIDYHLSLRDGIRAVFFNFSHLRFRDIKVGKIIKNAHFSDLLAPTLLMYNTSVALLKNLARRKIKIKKIIYTFENNPVEKALLVAARKYLSETELIGYQHSVWYKEQLSMYLSKGEIGFHPLPDKIICTGEKYLDVLPSAGFPKEKLSIGAGLRFSDIHNIRQKKIGDKDINNKSVILVVLNYNPGHAMEMLGKLSRVLVKFDNFIVKIKSHPLLNIKEIEAFLSEINFLTYEWVDGKVQELVKSADVVIMGCASVSNLETIVMGSPLIRISLGGDFDFDPLWDDYMFKPLFYNEEELEEGLRKALNLNDRQKEELLYFGREILNKYFQPINEDNLKVYL